MKTREIEKLKERWKQACFNKHTGEYQQACISRDIWKACKGRGDVAYEILTRIGVKGNSKLRCKKMAEAISTIRSEKVWIAVGWYGVSRLLNMDESSRAESIKSIKSKARSGRLPEAVVRKLVVVKGHKRSSPAAKQLDPKKRLWALVNEVRRLVSEGYLNESALSHEAMLIVGLRKARRGA